MQVVFIIHEINRNCTVTDVSNLCTAVIEGDQNKHKLKKTTGISHSFDPSLLLVLGTLSLFTLLPIHNKVHNLPKFKLWVPSLDSFLYLSMVSRDNVTVSTIGTISISIEFKEQKKLKIKFHLI